MSVAYEMISGKPVAVPAVRPRHRFSLEEYEEMIRRGILDENQHLELIRGEIVEKMPIGDPHAACVIRLNRLFNTQLGADIAIVGIQTPVVVLDSRPEPDVVLVKPRKDEYATAAPRARDILLLIEVADSSLAYDRTEKLSLYAEAGVPEYWIANVSAECVEVYRDPQPNGTYADRHIANRGETLGILALPSISLAVDQVFKSRGDQELDRPQS